jgi:hypothetical protein
MGSSSSAKPRGKPRKLLRGDGGQGSEGAGGGGSASGSGAGRSPRRASSALRLERVDRSIARQVAEGDQLALVDDGRDVAVTWQRQTLGFIRRSELITVRNSGCTAARISKIVLPTGIWILLA